MDYITNSICFLSGESFCPTYLNCALWCNHCNLTFIKYWFKSHQLLDPDTTYQNYNYFTSGFLKNGKQKVDKMLKEWGPLIYMHRAYFSWQQNHAGLRVMDCRSLRHKCNYSMCLLWVQLSAQENQIWKSKGLQIQRMETPFIIEQLLWQIKYAELVKKTKQWLRFLRCSFWKGKTF